MSKESHIVLTQNMISSKTFEQYVTEWKQHDSWIHTLFDRVIALENKVEKLEQPQRLEALTALLAKETHPRSSRWISGRIRLAYNDLEDFIKMGKLYSAYHGCIEMYSLNPIILINESSIVTEKKEKQNV